MAPGGGSGYPAHRSVGSRTSIEALKHDGEGCRDGSVASSNIGSGSYGNTSAWLSLERGTRELPQEVAHTHSGVLVETT